MEEPAEVTVRKVFIGIPCQIILSLERVPFTTLIPYTSWRGSKTQQVQMAMHSQSKPTLLFTLILLWVLVTLMMPVSDKQVFRFPTFDCLSASSALFIRLKGYRICGIYVFTGISGHVHMNEGVHIWFVSHKPNLEILQKISICDWSFGLDQVTNVQLQQAHRRCKNPKTTFNIHFKKIQLRSLRHPLVQQFRRATPLVTCRNCLTKLLGNCNLCVIHDTPTNVVTKLARLQPRPYP